MNKRNEELTAIIAKFAQSGWDVIDGPSQAWLDAPDGALDAASAALKAAVTDADAQCGSCGCEYDPLYKRALVLLSA